MELFIFARFHARPGNEDAVAAALLDVIAPTREEPGCVSVHAFRATRDPRLLHPARAGATGRVRAPRRPAPAVRFPRRVRL
jgi:hypothetical protein